MCRVYQRVPIGERVVYFNGSWYLAMSGRRIDVDVNLATPESLDHPLEGVLVEKQSRLNFVVVDIGPLALFSVPPSPSDVLIVNHSLDLSQRAALVSVLGLQSAPFSRDYPALAVAPTSNDVILVRDSAAMYNRGPKSEAFQSPVRRLPFAVPSAAVTLVVLGCSSSVWPCCDRTRGPLVPTILPSSAML